MKKIYLAFVLFFPTLAFAQQVPPAYDFADGYQYLLPLVELETFDHVQLLAEDTRIEEEGGRTNYGRRTFQKMDPTNSGKWTDNLDGSRMWQLRFRSQGALAVNVYFENFFIPQGAQLYLYSVDRSFFEGPFTSDDNDSHGRFSIPEVYGGEAILEYYEPYGVVENPRLGIHAFGHFYRYIYNHVDNRGGGSEPCEVDVNCPEGTEWSAQRDAVVRLQIPDGKFIGFCSGVLVLTADNSCHNYILSALHCALTSTVDDIAEMQIKFNYERSGCGSGSSVSTHNKSGAVMVANSDDGGGESGSDFVLFEMDDNITESWTPFYAGWDNTGDGSPSGVCIHHPAGDRKKISSYNDDLISVWIGAPGSHWQVEWVETETEWGVTEGGSSGSPIFSADKRIVGTLTGGGSFCNNPDEPDYYGKFSKHWDSNPNNTDEKLKFWLDPQNWGVEMVDGVYKNCDINSVYEQAPIEFSDIQVFPNSGSELISIVTSLFGQINEVRMFDSSGALVKTFDLSANTTSLDFSNYASGFYYLTFVHHNNSFVTKKIVRI